MRTTDPRNYAPTTRTGLQAKSTLLASQFLHRIKTQAGGGL